MPKNLKLWTTYTFHIPLLRATARSRAQGDESEKEWPSDDGNKTEHATEHKTKPPTTGARSGGSGSPSEEVPSPIFSASWSSEARKDQNTNAAGPHCITNSRRGHPRQQPAAVEMDPTNPHETASTLTTLMMETIEGLYGMGGTNRDLIKNPRADPRAIAGGKHPLPLLLETPQRGQNYAYAERAEPGHRLRPSMGHRHTTWWEWRTSCPAETRCRRRNDETSQPGHKLVPAYHTALGDPVGLVDELLREPRAAQPLLQPGRPEPELQGHTGQCD